MKQVVSLHFIHSFQNSNCIACVIPQNIWSYQKNNWSYRYPTAIAWYLTKYQKQQVFAHENSRDQQFRVTSALYTLSKYIIVDQSETNQIACFIFLAAVWLKHLPLMQMERVAVDRWAQQLFVNHANPFKRHTAGSPEIHTAYYPTQWTGMVCRSSMHWQYTTFAA